MQTITLTRSGLTIDGVPFTLLAGQLHYFRFPKAEWRDQLLKARAGGLNTIDTVIPWNLHEPSAGAFDFAAGADLPAYLDLCHELGLFAIVRPGPYICAEWENGGFPAWLTAQPGVELRVDNPIFLAATLRWFDALFPILAARQVTRGGPIILCQIENEHWASGRYGHDVHQDTLARAAIERGIDVPQYTCMGAMRDWPELRNGWSGIAEKLVQTRAAWPDNPMIVSELWSGWFDNWGASRHNHKTPERLDMILHQLTAVGASGWSHWMWAGGTNFGYWGGRTVGGDTIHMTTSYDYDAPVSEYGGLPEKFFVARRHHLFMATLGAQLAGVLADAVPGGPRVIAPAAVAGRGEAGGAPYRSVRAGSTAPDGWSRLTATFLQNAGAEGQTHQLFLEQPAAHLVVEVEAQSIKPIFTNLPLAASGWTLEYHTARILGFWRYAEGDTLVLYGREGETGELRLSSTGDTPCVEETPASNVSLAADHASLHLRFWIADRPTAVVARAGERVLTIVLLTQARAERWWPIAGGAVCGPHLLRGGDLSGAQPSLAVDARGVMPFYFVGADGRVLMLQAGLSQAGTVAPSVVWSGDDGAAPLVWTRHAVAEATDAEGWRAIERPVALEELGCDLGYGWYRAELDAGAEMETTLAAPWLNDRARVLLDGVDVGWLGVHPHGARLALPLKLTAGRHELRLLVDNLGRFNYGSNTGERKGLLDTLYLGGEQRDLTGGWVVLWQEAAFAGEAIANAQPAFVRPDAVDVRLDNFAFQGPSVWLLRELTARAGRRYMLRMTGDRNPGALFVNGVALVRFSRHHGGGYINADITDLLHAGANVLALNIQGYAGAPWRATLLEFDSVRALDAQWSFRAGVTPGLGDSGQQTGDRANTALPDALGPAAPCFHRAAFTYDTATHGGGPFRLHMPGMRKGQIWLNGQNLGRYWQDAGPQESYKLPVAWLQPHNELLLFDEEGADPRAVWIGTDALAAEQFVEITLR
jgi:hypothetical protein